MAAEAGLYLAKARESLESARADMEAGRYNSVANRSYYAAFQAAVAMLMTAGVRRRKSSWEHRFVIGEFDKLVSRRRALPRNIRGLLARLLEARLTADYEALATKAANARNRLREATMVVEQVILRLRESGVHGR